MSKHRKYLVIVIIILVLLPLARMGYRYGRLAYISAKDKRQARLPELARRQVSDVIAKVGPSARMRLQPYFDQARVLYPPSKVTFLAFKQEKTLELWAEKGTRWVYIRTYPILAASGQAGPKLRQGDRQVPEGIYGVAGLNPNSSYHLSIKINYPNNFDQQKSALDKRTDLGGDIFIHGRDRSIGCLAMGDEAIEELFTLVNDVGVNRIRVIIAPYDMRPDVSPSMRGAPHPAASERKWPPVVPDPNIPWLPELYGILSQELQDYR